MRIALPYLCVDVQLLATFQLSLAVGDWWIGVFLGDKGNDNTLLHISDSMEALAAVRPSMFTDITVRSVERLWLVTADIVLL